METTDAGVVSQDDPTTRGAHTHHITMTGPISADTSTCPASDPANPPVAWRFAISGPAQITGNGNQAPFQVKLGTFNLRVCVGGGADGTLQVSNVIAYCVGCASPFCSVDCISPAADLVGSRSRKRRERETLVPITSP
jgi:hypothetical protein